MKAKFYLIAAAACAALAACSKNEVAPVDVDQEITYQTLSTKGTVTGFNTDNKFYSYAFFLEGGLNWDSNSALAKPYIDNSIISYQSGTKQWKNADDTYYWPKQGSLTFFAWTDNTAAPAVKSPATVTCSNTTGIKFTNYDVQADKNKDLMVAEIAANKTANEGTGHTYNDPVDPSNSRTWGSGVPTNFKRVLSKLEFKVKTAGNYSGVTIKVKSLKLKSVEHKGTYTQPLASTADPRQLTAWSNESDQVDLTVYTNSGFTVNNSFQNLEPINSDYYIVLPQTLKSGMQLELVYDYITNYGTSFTQEFTETRELTSIYNASWEPGKKYTLEITFGLNEILWDPTVEDWDDGVTTGITL